PDTSTMGAKRERSGSFMGKPPGELTRSFALWMPGMNRRAAWENSGARRRRFVTLVAESRAWRAVLTGPGVDRCRAGTGPRIWPSRSGAARLRRLEDTPMKIGILGTGIVGSTIASKLVQLGNDVKMGSRAAGSDKAVAWTKSNGARASEGSYADAAAFGELLFNCTSG